MNRIPQDIHIPSYMNDWAERLKPVSFMELAQEIAQHGADCLGFGHDPMAEHGATWVLSRMHIIFEKMPKWKDDVRFETWHKALNGLLFLRDFEMLDAERNVLVSATSSWLIMDVAERLLCRPDRFSGLIPTEPQCPGDAIKEPARFDVVINDSCLRTCPVRKDHLRLLAAMRKDAYDVRLMQQRANLIARTECQKQDPAELHQKQSGNLTHDEIRALYNRGMRHYLIQSSQFRNEMTLLWDVFQCMLDRSPDISNKAAVISTSAMAEFGRAKDQLPSGLTDFSFTNYE